MQIRPTPEIMNRVRTLNISDLNEIKTFILRQTPHGCYGFLISFN